MGFIRPWQILAAWLVATAISVGAVSYAHVPPVPNAPPSGPAKSVWAECFSEQMTIGLVMLKENVITIPLFNALPTPALPYRVVKRLGSGGYAEVFQATDEKNQREVVLKVNHNSGHDPTRAMMAHEFDMQQLAFRGSTGGHVVEPFAFHNEGDLQFIVMQLVPQSMSIRQLMQSHHSGKVPGGRGLKEEIALPILIHAVEAVKDLHDQEIVHGDLKGENFQLTEERVYLFDFGLAFLRKNREKVLKAQGNEMLGTPQYWSPEYVRGIRLDYGEDIWALGVLIHFVATGRLPFAAVPPFRYEQVDFQREGRLLQIDEDISPGLKHIIQTALHPRPEARYLTVDALFAELKNLQAQREVRLPEPAQTPARNWPPARPGFFRRLLGF